MKNPLDEIEKRLQDTQDLLNEASARRSAEEEKGVEPMTEEEEARRRNLNLILDIPLEVSVELGRNKMLINDLLQLGRGSVIELNKLAGEPLEVLVNGRLVARGEVVVLHDKFGVRLTDIISPSERIQQLSG